jgi:pyoverdine/dityrosine biosynthesis protein Dit1
MNKNLFTYALCCMCVIMGGIFAYKKVMHIRNERISSRIYKLLDEYRIPYDIDKRSIDQTADTTPQLAQGVEACIENIALFVRENKPIHMLLVGFPFKSHNQEKKVIGSKLDLAERKSLEYLQEMLSRIKTIYRPGAKILIFCDGIPFAEYFGIPQADVVAYEHDLKTITSDLPDITILDSDDMMQKYGLSNRDGIITLFDSYEPTDEQFKKDMKIIPASAIERFALELDSAQGKRLVQKYGLNTIAYGLMARETRMRNFISQAFPAQEYFRLTVHLSPDISKKFGIRLSPQSNVTPYHGALVQEKNGQWMICFKKDIDQQRYTLQSKEINGITCPYYQEL